MHFPIRQEDPYFPERKVKAMEGVVDPSTSGSGGGGGGGGSSGGGYISFRSGGSSTYHHHHHQGSKSGSGSRGEGRRQTVEELLVDNPGLLTCGHKFKWEEGEKREVSIKALVHPEVRVRVRVRGVRVRGRGGRREEEGCRLKLCSIPR